MLPPADPTGARPLRGIEPIKPSTSASDPQREVFNRLTQIAAGKMFQAEVLSRFNDGTYLVKIDNAAFKAALPGDPQVGDFLALKFVAGTPRPTFALMPRTDTDSASLSAAAKLIGTILRATAQDTEAVIAGKMPVLPGGSADASAIASGLKSSLAMSGLFYESHLRQWADGSRSLADLQQEAQARPNLPLTLHGSTARPDAASSGQLVTILSEWNGPMATGTDAAATGSAPAPERLSNESMQLVNMQLQALEQGKIAWQGEVWPGQPLEWEVSEDKSQQDEAGQGTLAWTSEVRFSLPTLGVVSAHIRLCDNRVQMHVRAATEETAVLLQTHGTELAGALDAAGSPLESFQVKLDAQA